MDIVRLENQSTHLYAKSRVFHTDTLILARRQDDGKGRGEKTYLSNEGGLYMTLVLPLLPAVSFFPSVPLVAPLSVTYALRAHGVESGIKWPNDVMVNGKKICGILCAATGNYLLVSIGINVNNDVSALNSVAINTKMLGLEIDPENLAREVTQEFYKLKDLNGSILADLYKKDCLTLGKPFPLNGEQTGKAIDIDENGFLLVKYKGKIHKILNPIA